MLIILLSLLFLGCDFFELDSDQMRCYADAECGTGQFCNTINRCEPKKNPCLGIETCGGNGECIAHDSVAVCNCKTGFQDHDHNLTCDQECPDPLPENTLCDDRSGTMIITCEAGYQDKDHNNSCTPDCASTCDLTIQFCDDSSGTASCGFPEYTFKTVSESDVTGEFITRNPNNSNLYFAGHLFGTADFDPSSEEDLKTLSTNRGIYLSSFDQNLRYLNTITLSATEEIQLKSIVSDSQGNILLTGYFKGYLDADPDPDVQVILESEQNQNLFFIKLSPESTYIKSFAIGAETKTAGDSIIVDNSDNIYIGGHYLNLPQNSTINLNPLSGEESLHDSTATDRSAGFIIRINSDLTFGWSFQISSPLFNNGGFTSPIIIPAKPETEKVEGIYNKMLNHPKSVYLSIRDNSLISVSHFETDYYSDYQTGLNTYLFALISLEGQGRLNWPILADKSDLIGTAIPMPNRKIYLAGSFKGTVNFNFLSLVDPKTFGVAKEHSSTKNKDGENTYDLFIGEFSLARLQLERLMIIKNSGNIIVKDYHIATDYKIYVYGTYTKSAQFNGETTELSTQNDQGEFTKDIFLFKADFSDFSTTTLDYNAPIEWVKTLSDKSDLIAGEILPYDDKTIITSSTVKTLLGTGFNITNKPYASVGDHDAMFIKTDIE